MPEQDVGWESVISVAQPQPQREFFLFVIGLDLLEIFHDARLMEVEHK
jgi:hypothetical protein